MRSILWLGVIICSFLGLHVPSFSQNNFIEVSGIVQEGSSGQPVAYATVLLAAPKDGSVLAGTTTQEDGSFRLKTTAQHFQLEVSFIGYETKELTGLDASSGNLRLGIIVLSESSQALDEIVVRGQKSTTEFKIDKRVFNVGQDLSSAGASALEVLNNVPSVTVNIEGQISLRGSSGVQVLINGKPSVLASEEGNALGSITADMIEKIEVITNPSAKYEAEGTSGIINIVLKKEEKKGINGSLSLNTGTPHNHSIGASINRRTEKFNLFSQFGLGYRELPRDNENINKDQRTGRTIYSEGRNYRNEEFYNISLGTDYHIDGYNVVTLSGNFAYEIEDQPSETNFRFSDRNEQTLQTWHRSETTDANNPKWQYELQYNRSFKDDKDHRLNFGALGSFFGKDQNSLFTDRYDDTDQLILQETETDFSEAQYTFKLDYTKPFTEKITMEAGAQYVIQDVSNDFEVRNFTDQEWIVDPNFTNVFEYVQKVLGTYGTASYEGDKWGVKVGLRLENTELNTLLKTTNQKNDQNYTNLFPSMHLSYKSSDRLSIQTGYSRRVYRPRLWDLNPFFNIRDNYNIRTGNPELLPVFTDSYEANAIYILEKASLNFGVYHRYSEDVIERIAQFKENVSIVRPVNVGTNRTTGLEFNGKYSPAKWLDVTADVNYSTFSRQGALESTSFDFSADRWSSRLRAKSKLPADIDIELTGNYNSGYQTVQGRVLENAFADLGIRKKILKGKAVVNASVRDIFASRFFKAEVLQDDFYAYSFGQRGRFVTFGFSYGFGKGEAMHYSGRRR